MHSTQTSRAHTYLTTKLPSQHDATPIVHLVHFDLVLTFVQLESSSRDLSRDPKGATGELLAVLAVAERCPGVFVWVVERDCVADGGAVAAAGEGWHF